MISKKKWSQKRGVFGRGDERLGLNGGEEGERETGLPSLIETSRKQNERITLTCLVKHERGSLHDKCNKCLIKMAWTLYLGLVPPTTIWYHDTLLIVQISDFLHDVCGKAKSKQKEKTNKNFRNPLNSISHQRWNSTLQYDFYTFSLKVVLWQKNSFKAYS